MSESRCVEISWTFMGPVAKPSYPIHLDAVLLYANAEHPVLADAVRPLLDTAVESHGEGESRIYCCSAIEFEEAECFTRFNTRRFDLDVYAKDMDAGLVSGRLASAVDLIRGPVKGILEDIPMMWVKGAKAYAMVRDFEVFERLLTNVSQIGKYGRLGYGRVSSLSYDPDVEAPRDAWMRRVLPFHVEGAAPLRATISPPYWDRSRAVNAYLHPALVA